MDLTKRNILMSSILVIYVITVTLAEQTNTCLLQCMRDVLKCKRFEHNSFLSESEMECCDKYTLCYFLCQPGASTAPSCDNKVKRGSWNKRQVTQGSWRNRGWFQALSSEDDFSKDNQFYL